MYYRIAEATVLNSIQIRFRRMKKPELYSEEFAKINV